MNTIFVALVLLMNISSAVASAAEDQSQANQIHQQGSTPSQTSTSTTSSQSSQSATRESSPPQVAPKPSMADYCREHTC